MHLSHYSSHPPSRPFLPRTIVQPPLAPGEYASCFAKPKGLWVSVDGPNDWPSWCVDNSYFESMSGTHYRVILTTAPHILLLSSPTALRNFRRRYGESNSQADYADDRFNHPYIRWHLVAKDYNGIIIAPYQFTCRLSESWYYGWDCASGCIWNAAAIASVTPVVNHPSNTKRSKATN